MFNHTAKLLSISSDTLDGCLTARHPGQQSAGRSAFLATGALGAIHGKEMMDADVSSREPGGRPRGLCRISDELGGALTEALGGPIHPWTLGIRRAWIGKVDVGILQLGKDRVEFPEASECHGESSDWVT